MDLATLVPPQAIVLELKEQNRDGIHMEMVDHLVAQKLLPVKMREVVLDGLRVREEKMTTAIGGGLALPHTSIAGLPQVVAGFARCSAGVDCSALDQQPVHLFFMILVPTDQYTQHLRTLAMASKFFNKSSTREKLLAAKTVEEIHTLFKEAAPAPEST